MSIGGYENYPSRISKDSSSLYSRNLYNFVQLLVNQEELHFHKYMQLIIVIGYDSTLFTGDDGIEKMSLSIKFEKRIRQYFAY